jgi:hypothetical protein
VSKFVKKVGLEKLFDEHKTRKLCYSQSGSMCGAFEAIFSEMQIDELDQLPGRKRLSE